MVIGECHHIVNGLLKKNSHKPAW